MTGGPTLQSSIQVMPITLFADSRMHRLASISVILMAPWLSFLRADSSRIEKRQEAEIEYLGEKTGPVEDDLKKSLSAVLEKNFDVQRAYLAIISTDRRKSWSVALCLVSKKNDKKLIRELGEVFHHMFGKDQFLDMLFLSEDSERKVQKVCPPFFTKKEDA